jgi:predicted enzyme related to lactoylglutathione lyase
MGAEEAMTKRESNEPNTVGWVDLQVSDVVRARAFYGALLGWSFQGGDDPDLGYYTMAQLDGRDVAGLAQLSQESGYPPRWNVFFATDQVDALADRVHALGGKVMVAPMDVLDWGRTAFFADPTCAPFGGWQANRHCGAQVVNQPGAMAWHEVYTRDATQARAFYSNLLGLEGERLQVPAVEYWTLRKGSQVVCGLMQMTAQFPPEVTSHWNTYFAVGDVDGSYAQAIALGGTQISPPFDTPLGRVAFLVDPLGAAFCLMGSGSRQA